MPAATQLFRAALLGACAAASGQSYAATLTGTVTSADGKPLAGAMVTLWNSAKNAKETVYTNAEGDYSLTSE